MNDALPVGAIHGLGQNLHHLSRRENRLRIAFELALQTAAIDVFQRKVWAAIMVADFIYLNDVGVLQLANGLCFGAEPAQFHLTGMATGQDHLERHDTLDAALPRLIHHPHRSATENA